MQFAQFLLAGDCKAVHVGAADLLLALLNEAGRPTGAGNITEDRDLQKRRSEIRQSENTILDVWSQPGFFLAGGLAVLALLIVFVLLEAAG